MSHAFWEPKDELFGLFDIRSFRKIESIVSSGLGGGSLIYANVLLRKDERWFVHDSPLPGGGYENWPIGRERPRPSLRLRRGDDDPDPEPLPRSAEIEGPARGRPGARAAGDRAAARGVVRLAARGHRTAEAADRGSGVRQHPRGDPAHLPAVRRVRHRLQRGLEEHPRSQLPVCRGLQGRRHPHARRGVRHHAAGRRRLRSPLSPVRDGCRGRRQAPSRARDRHVRPALPRRGHVRDDCAPPPQSRRAARARARARQPLQRQRRPHHVLLQREDDLRRRASCGSSTRHTGRSSPPPSASPTASTRRVRAAGTTCRRRASRTSPTGSSRPLRSRRR